MRRGARPGLWLLPLLVAVGLLLRLVGLRYGFPLLHPDEPSVVQPAHDMIVGHTLDPGFFKRPNHFSIYWSALLYQPLSRLLLHKDFVTAYAENLDFFYVVSRSVVAVAGTLSIVIGYFVGREFSRARRLPRGRRRRSPPRIRREFALRHPRCHADPPADAGGALLPALPAAAVAGQPGPRRTVRRRGDHREVPRRTVAPAGPDRRGRRARQAMAASTVASRR